MSGSMDDDGHFDPRCDRPRHLVAPLRAGRAGRPGADLTWDRANGPRYERIGKGLYVPVDRRRSPEQRVLDAAARLPKDGSRGFVTGWGALRWRQAAYFDGRPAHGVGEVPVELAIDGRTSMRPWDGVVMSRRLVGMAEHDVLHGVPVATVQRALFDEIARRDDLWSAVQAVDMAAAAGLISVWLFATYVGDCNARTGAPLARSACALAVDESRSPRETWMRLVWVLVASLPDPVVNRPVYDLEGRLLGVPDLLDTEAGLVGEYSGAVHKGREQHRSDIAREARFRDHGLEYVEVVAGDTREAAAARIRSAWARARAIRAEARRWTVVAPPSARAVETLDAHLERTGQVERLTAFRGTPLPGQGSEVARP